MSAHNLICVAVPTLRIVGGSGWWKPEPGGECATLFVWEGVFWSKPFRKPCSQLEEVGFLLGVLGGRLPNIDQNYTSVDPKQSNVQK